MGPILIVLLKLVYTKFEI